MFAVGATDTFTFTRSPESPTCAPLPGPSAAEAQGWQAGARKRLTPEPPQASLGILYRMTVCVTGRQARAAEPERRGVLRCAAEPYCHILDTVKGTDEKVYRGGVVALSQPTPERPRLLYYQKTSQYRVRQQRSPWSRAAGVSNSCAAAGTAPVRPGVACSKVRAHYSCARGSRHCSSTP